MMTDNLKQNFADIDRDLSHSWIDLSKSVKNLSAELSTRCAGTAAAGEAAHLAQQTTRLCDHVERIHADVIELLENMETRFPISDQMHANGTALEKRFPTDEIDQEKIQIQRESHEMRSDFKDVLKALFMWVDDPHERVKERK